MGGKLLIVCLSACLLLSAVLCDRIPCNKKYFPDSGGDSFVCVCNSTYCDTVESIDQQDKDTTYQEYITCKNRMRLDKFKNKFDQAKANDSDLVFTINRSKSYQAIFGFGGAVTDATGYNIFALSSATVSNFLKSYFSVDGLEYNVLRVPVGGVDFSVRPYTYDDVADDFNLSQFSLQPEDIKWKLPIIQTALNLTQKEIKFFASAWSAPGWMKTNNDIKGNGTLIGPPGGKYYQIWANYYVKFFQEYEKNGVKFWGMTAQNEPTDGGIYKFPFNNMGFTPETQATFVAENLGPTLAQNGYGNIKIMILDDQRLYLPAWPQKVFDFSKAAAKYVSGIAVHWYMDSIIPASILDKTHELFPDKFLFGTEACIGQGPQQHVILGSFVRAEEYARYILQDLNHWVTGWTDWNMALDMKGGPNWSNNYVDSPVIVNAAQDEFYKQPMFYIMGHFSKLIPVNSVRIDLNLVGQAKEIYSAAFYDATSKQTTVVLLNISEFNKNYSIYDPDLKVYLNGMLASHSIKTFVWFDK